MFAFVGQLIRNNSFTVKKVRRAWATRKSMNKFRNTHTECEWCGRANRLQVHHIIPVSVSPDLAGNPSNMMMLCGKGCHLRFGHNGDFRSRYVDNIKDLCSAKRVIKTVKGL